MTPRSLASVVVLGAWIGAGLVAACALVARGEGADRAMEIVRAARCAAIERDSQEEFVRTFETAWHLARRGRLAGPA